LWAAPLVLLMIPGMIVFHVVVFDPNDGCMPDVPEDTGDEV